MKITDREYNKHKTEWFKIVPYDYVTAEKHLAEMAAKGWILDEIGTYGWRYKKCNPAKMRFAITFVNSYEDDVQPESASMLESYYASKGWKKLIVWQKMHIYYNMNPEGEPFEKDEMSRLENTWSAIKNGYIPQAVILLIVQGLALFRNIKGYIETGVPIGEEEILLFFALGCAVLAPLAMLLSYWKWYKKSKEDVKQKGQIFRMKRIGFIGKLFMALAMVLLAAWCAVTNSVQAAIIVVIILIAVSFIHKPAKSDFH